MAGFDAGDTLLRGVSTVLKQQLRSVDVICRYSGDQFALVLPETKSQQAQAVTGKLITQIEAHSSAQLDGKRVVHVASANVNYPESSDNEMELVRTVLSRLAESKQQTSS